MDSTNDPDWLAGPKTCATCGAEKTRADFRKNGGMPEGLHKHCRECMRAEERGRSSEWKAKRNERQKKTYPARAEHQQAKQRERYVQDPKYRQRTVNRSRHWYYQNHKRAKAQRMEYHLSHKEEHRQYHIERYEERAAWFIRQKEGHSCVRCGESDWRCLDWHHIDPKTKVFNVSEGHTSGTWSIDEVLAEIAKCETICANCHRKMHWEERQVGRLKQAPLPLTI